MEGEIKPVRRGSLWAVHTAWRPLGARAMGVDGAIEDAGAAKHIRSPWMTSPCCWLWGLHPRPVWTTKAGQPAAPAAPRAARRSLSAKVDCGRRTCLVRLPALLSRLPHLRGPVQTPPPQRPEINHLFLFGQFRSWELICTVKERQALGAARLNDWNTESTGHQLPAGHRSLARTGTHAPSRQSLEGGAVTAPISQRRK